MPVDGCYGRGGGILGRGALFKEAKATKKVKEIKVVKTVKDIKEFKEFKKVKFLRGQGWQYGHECQGYQVDKAVNKVKKAKGVKE